MSRRSRSGKSRPVRPSRPHVLVLVENLSVPADRRVTQESRALVDAGYDVSVICPQGTDRDTEPHAVIDGVEIHRYPLRAATGGPAGYISEYATALWQTARIAHRINKRRPVHVVHACNPPDLLLLPVLPARLRGARFVFDHHDLVPELFESRFGGRGVLYWGVRAVEWFNFKLAHMVISTNDSYRDVALRRGRKRPESVHVVRSAPDLARFVTVDPAPELRKGRRHLLCYLGVMGPQDGVDYALRAVAHLRHELGRDDVHTVLLGTGDAFDDLVALAKELRIDDVVDFAGWADDTMIQEALSTADIGLSPDPTSPLNDVSTMNKIVEYMAMGLPVVTFDLKEGRVSAGDAAVYAPPNQIEAFAAAIAELLDDPERRTAMGRVGQDRVAERLSWDVSRRNLIAAYDTLWASETD